MMTNAEARDLAERTDRFVEELRNAISEAVASVDPHSLCADAQRRGLRRIADTLHDVDPVTVANLANLNEALQYCTGTGLLAIIEGHLLAVGGGPTLDHPDATAFLATFQPMIDLARNRRIN
jgi:hypothetical protein